MTPPEMDNYEEDEDRRLLYALYESSSLDILDQMNKDTFKDTYKILRGDITSLSLKDQKIFIEKYMDKMAEIYEYEFSQNPVYDSEEAINKMFKFIEFVEFDNLTFLKYVWSYLEDILSVKIEDYVFENSDAIIEEITNQANLLTTLTENTSEFLRTYNKEGILEWFINRSERNKYDIYAENLE
jgi:hypothetical protein